MWVPTCRNAAANADAVVAQEFLPALDAGIIRLQNMIEGLCHDLKKKEQKRDAKAGAVVWGVQWCASPDVL
jgi:hypothetical protein